MITAAQQTTEPAPDTQAETLHNACKHGIHAEAEVMFDEAAEALAGLAAELHFLHRTADATERFLVDTRVSNEWRLRRMRNVDTDLWPTAVGAYLYNHVEMERATGAEHPWLNISDKYFKVVSTGVIEGFAAESQRGLLPRDPGAASCGL
jgi:hypothetical protein